MPNCDTFYFVAPVSCLFLYLPECLCRPTMPLLEREVNNFSHFLTHFHFPDSNANRWKGHLTRVFVAIKEPRGVENSKSTVHTHCSNLAGKLWNLLAAAVFCRSQKENSLSLLLAFAGNALPALFYSTRPQVPPCHPPTPFAAAQAADRPTSLSLSLCTRRNNGPVAIVFLALSGVMNEKCRRGISHLKNTLPRRVCVCILK